MFDRLIHALSDPEGLTPHGFCLLWEPGLLWSYAISDAGIGIAYFSIPVFLAIFARRRQDLLFRPVYWLFATFILLCGTSHWLDVLTLWVPAYTIEAIVKAATAIVSLVTAVVMWRLLPEALAIPSSQQLQAANVAIARSEARHRASFEHSPVPVYIVDRHDVLTAVSDTWLKLLGYERAAVIGRCIRDFVSEASNKLGEDDRRRLLEEGQLLDQERDFLRQDGTVVNALVSARVDQQSDDLSVVCVLIDVTAKRQTERALRLSEEHLRQSQKMDAVGQLTGGIAHDFNNMLQGIGSCLDLIDRRIGQGRTEEIGHYAGVARQSVDRAAKLTQRMLAFARRQSLQPTAVEPDTLVQGMAELIRRTIGPAVRLELNLHDGIWNARCDANQLESSMLNLAINARDAMPEGGTLTISTWDRRVTAAELSGQGGEMPGDYIEIAVTDTGTGIEASVLPRVFEPFFTTKPIGQGTGLGLSQVYGFVQQSGGMLRIESEVGKGTTVRLYLPRDLSVHVASPEGGAEAPLPEGGAEAPLLEGGAGAPLLEGGAGASLLEGGAGAPLLEGGAGAPLPEGGAGAPLPEGGAGAPWVPGGCGAAAGQPEVVAGRSALGRSVLLVEDEAGVRSPIAEALVELGCQVLQADDGVAGLEVLRSPARIDLLLTDVGLPRLDGRQLAETARSLRPRLPVILMTGYAGRVLEDLPLAPGMVVIRKPFDLEALCDQVMALTGS